MGWEMELHEKLKAALGEVFVGVNYPPLEVAVSRELTGEEFETVKGIVGQYPIVLVI